MKKQFFKNRLQNKQKANLVFSYCIKDSNRGNKNEIKKIPKFNKKNSKKQQKKDHEKAFNFIYSNSCLYSASKRKCFHRKHSINTAHSQLTKKTAKQENNEIVNSA